jgi:uncharacterized membrane protein YebE (DUF533 family)
MTSAATSPETWISARHDVALVDADTHATQREAAQGEHDALIMTGKRRVTSARRVRCAAGCATLLAVALDELAGEARNPAQRAQQRDEHARRSPPSGTSSHANGASSPPRRLLQLPGEVLADLEVYVRRV